MLQPRHHPLVRGKPEIWSVPSVQGLMLSPASRFLFFFLCFFWGKVLACPIGSC